jgi:hypothetical protein
VRVAGNTVYAKITFGNNERLLFISSVSLIQLCAKYYFSLLLFDVYNLTGTTIQKK